MNTNNDDRELYQEEARAIEADLRSHLEVAQDEHSFQNWYLRVWNNLDGEADRLKEQYAAMQAAVLRRRQLLAYRYGTKFMEAVKADIKAQGGKKKSVSYLQGKAGFRRKQGSVDVHDADAALKWALEWAPETLKIGTVTPFKTWIKDGQDVPGVRLTEPSESFFPIVQSLPQELTTIFENIDQGEQEDGND